MGEEEGGEVVRYNGEPGEARKMIIVPPPSTCFVGEEVPTNEHPFQALLVRQEQRLTLFPAKWYLFTTYVLKSS